MTILAAMNCGGETHLIITNGSTYSSSITNLRLNSIIESGATPIILINGSTTYDIKTFSPIIQDLINDGKIKVVCDHYSRDDLITRGRSEVENVVDKVFIILPIAEDDLKFEISTQCRKLRIPINVSDSPELCTFTLLSSYQDGDFKFGVTTLGKGCKLASRIKRELIGQLPSNIGEVCNKIGELRTKIQNEDNLSLENHTVGDNDDDAINTNKFNSLVEEFNMSKEQKKLQRSRWLSQIVEYFPLSKLADISIEDLTEAYKHNKIEIANKELNEEKPATKKTKLNKKGTISLIGSGPGSVSLLTLGALQEIYSADLILADKLVPQQVLDLIPQKSTKLFIARKFPGNAEKAQEELLSIGLESLLNGEKVVRLKQGDPYIFGRGGEEFNFFMNHGFKPIVLPGITSALSAPVLSNIPVTHRDVADQVLICTGTGRRGVLPNLPDFVKSRTTVFLMALHRIVDLIPKLIDDKNWDPNLPVAIIERSSCPDQRVIRTTLSKTAQAVEACGSRPPGLLVTGYSCEVIFKEQDQLKEKGWIIEEGYDYTNDNLNQFISLASTSIKKDTNFIHPSVDGAAATPPPDTFIT